MAESEDRPVPAALLSELRRIRAEAQASANKLARLELERVSELGRFAELQRRFQNAARAAILTCGADGNDEWELDVEAGTARKVSTER